MKLVFEAAIVTFLMLSNTLVSHNQAIKKKHNRKGNFFFYWGRNWSHFSKSDINFKGEDYNFTLKKVITNDRPSNLILELILILSGFLHLSTILD